MDDVIHVAAGGAEGDQCSAAAAILGPTLSPKKGLPRRHLWRAIRMIKQLGEPYELPGQPNVKVPGGKLVRGPLFGLSPPAMEGAPEDMQIDVEQRQAPARNVALVFGKRKASEAMAADTVGVHDEVELQLAVAQRCSRFELKDLDGRVVDASVFDALPTHSHIRTPVIVEVQSSITQLPAPHLSGVASSSSTPLASPLACDVSEVDTTTDSHLGAPELGDEGASTGMPMDASSDSGEATDARSTPPPNSEQAAPIMWLCLSCNNQNNMNEATCVFKGADRRLCNSTRESGIVPDEGRRGATKATARGGKSGRNVSLRDASRSPPDDAPDKPAPAPSPSAVAQLTTTNVASGDGSDSQNRPIANYGASSSSEQVVDSFSAPPLEVLNLKDHTLRSFKKEHIEAIAACHLTKGISTSWDSLSGVEHVRRLLEENVLGPLQYPELYADLAGGSSKGMLLFGPPGTGKTMIAKAIASQLSFHFFEIKGGNITSKWSGEAEKTVTALFAVARIAKPGAIIFIDECDNLLCNGTGEGAADHNKIVAAFKQEWDGISSGEGHIFVIGATNYPWKIESAVMREGRMDFKLHIGYPDVKSRLDILKREFRSWAIDDAGDTLDWVARQTEGYSGAGLVKSICREAQMGPNRDLQQQGINDPRQRRPIGRRDFERALRNAPAPDGTEATKHLKWNLDHGTKASAIYENG